MCCGPALPAGPMFLGRNGARDAVGYSATDVLFCRYSLFPGLPPTSGRVTRRHRASLRSLEIGNLLLDRAKRVFHLPVVYGLHVVGYKTEVLRLFLYMPEKPRIRLFQRLLIAKSHHSQSRPANRQALKRPRHRIICLYQLRIADSRMLTMGAIEPASDTVTGRGHLPCGQVSQQSDGMLTPAGFQCGVSSHPTDECSYSTGHSRERRPYRDRIHLLPPPNNSKTKLIAADSSSSESSSLVVLAEN